MKFEIDFDKFVQWAIEHDLNCDMCPLTPDQCAYYRNMNDNNTNEEKQAYCAKQFLKYFEIDYPDSDMPWEW